MSEYLFTCIDISPTLFLCQNFSFAFSIKSKNIKGKKFVLIMNKRQGCPLYSLMGIIYLLYVYY